MSNAKYLFVGIMVLIVMLLVASIILSKVDEWQVDNTVVGGNDTISLNGATTTIAWTDDNTKEDFIIKVDRQRINGFGGASLLFFSVTNVSTKSQDATIAFSFQEKPTILYAKRFLKNDLVRVDIPGTATSSASTIYNTKTIWEDMTLIDAKAPTSVTYERKPTTGANLKKGFEDTFAIGETKYYEADITTPKGIKNSEFFIEVFGTDSYGHLDPNGWTCEEKFNTLNHGNLEGQSSCGTAWGGTGGDVTDDGADTAYPDPTQIQFIKDDTSGIENTWATGGVSHGTMYISIMDTDDANNGTYVILFNNNGLTDINITQAGGQINAYDGHDPGYDFIQNYAQDTWYRLEIAWNCDADNTWENLGQYHWKMKVDNGAWSAEFGTERGNCTSMNTLKLYRVGGGSAYDYISDEYPAAAAAAPTMGTPPIIIEEE